METAAKTTIPTELQGSITRITEALHAKHVSILVRSYFDDTLPFASRTFHELPATDPNRFCQSDLFSLTLMGVRLHGATSRRLLHDEDGRYRKMLSRISTDARIGVGMGFAPMSEEHLAAKALWTELKDVPCMDEIKATKLLARKRPQLIPVVDSVVKMIVAAPGYRYWEVFDRAMRIPMIRERLEQLQPPQPVPPLRVLDAALWMLGASNEPLRKVRKACDLPAEPWAPNFAS